MMFRLVRELADQGFPVAVTCRVLNVSRSGYYDALDRGPSVRDIDDAHLVNLMREVHAMSRQTYGVRRVHAELQLGLGVPVGHGRVERLMRLAGLQGIHRRRWRGHHTGRLPAVFPDLVRRDFTAAGPNQLWLTDITEHRTPWIPAKGGSMKRPGSVGGSGVSRVSRRLDYWILVP